jgi:catechol 2,3-dioxygenase-like lactoylglutathione lyase family enzyme
MTALRSADLFHTGIIVPNLEEGAEALTKVAGYRWTRFMEAEPLMRLPGGDRPLRLRFAYSLDDPTIEIVEEVPGTPFTAVPTPAGGRSMHHYGFYADDLAASVAALQAEGYELETHAVVDGRLAVFAFVVSPSGMRMELIDRAVVPDLATYKRINA